jgi:hypothetical protein
MGVLTTGLTELGVALKGARDDEAVAPRFIDDEGLLQYPARVKKVQNGVTGAS